MKSDYRLLRGVAGQFVIGAILGALFVGLIILTDVQGIGAAIAAATFRSQRS
jgi:predicted alpha/beta superfamily hydrolase